MKIIHDKLDGVIYLDIILNEKELDVLSLGSMLEGHTCMERRSTYVGIRVEKGGRYEINPWEENDPWQEESEESDGRI